MNPTQPTYASTHQGSQINPLNGFTGFPIFPQGHPLTYGMPPGTQIPFMGLASATGAPIIAPAYQTFPPTDPSLLGSKPFHIQTPSEKMEHALQFLNKVKNTFIDQPYAYSQFLDIMKEFKNQRMDTSTVIEKVKMLFNGYPELIKGFNEFLPIPMHIPYEEKDKGYANISFPQQQPKQLGSPERSEEEAKKTEFDHARAYVKKIKQRFSTQPHIYKAFLDILHKFSKDQQSLSSVYEGVCELFKDHEDLLQEFTHFLPDTSFTTYERPTLPRKTRSTKPRYTDTYIEDEQSKQYSEESVERTGSYGTYEELEYFFKIKESLSKTDYEDFLKVLLLFNNNAITIIDLYYLVKDILRDVDDHIIKWFKSFLQVEDLVDDSDEPGGYLADFDWSRSEKLGPSYRSTPLKWRKWKCSGRADDPICAEVLNDTWISVPTGSEDGTFKNSRKNQYEELLFKCEDDRYELDLVIERNLSAIRYLETVYRDIIELPYEESSVFKLNKNELNILHINAIKSVYDYKGDEIIDLLVSKPLAAIPIILERLKQKDIAWRQSRNEWSKIWSLIFKNNYFKSLDHMSVDFKHEEKKKLNPKSLISELRKKESGRTKSSIQKSIKEPILSLEFKNVFIVEQVKKLVYVTFENFFQDMEVADIDEFYDSFLHKFIILDAKIKHMTMDETYSCKPINIPQEIVHENLYNLFVGTDTFYLMFRYFSILCSRLEVAWELSAKSKPIIYTPDPIQRVNDILKEDNKSQGDVKMNGEDISENDPQYQSKRFELFLSYVRKLLSNEIDQLEFENNCRSIFGPASYKLFTFDRLLILLSKQIYNIICDDTAWKLIELYHEELSKSSKPSYYIYLSNIREIISDKKVFVFTYKPKLYQLGIKYVDLSRAITNAEKEYIISRYTNYLVNNDKVSIQSKLPPFLNRNLKWSRQIDEENVDMFCNLGFKVMSDIHKIRYLENTEDYFHRKKKKHVK